ncbi:MAG TPA: glycoside hydrolase family 125 protein [Candidatus Limnocylindria bacterium]|jgi:meiotically up-regulated gene 157 (Mug157) protein|nr:glycoside hydrolase family 125 protein [Candidatus Limnocylindria bacterium]
MRLFVRAFFCMLAALAFVPRPTPAIELDAVAKAAAGYNAPDPKLAEMYRAALLDTSKLVTYAPDGTAYIKTGDIPAEWLRDASVQVRPYLFFAKGDMQVDTLLRGTIARMGHYLQVDPYANAFTLDYRVWEEKFELDSLAYPITLAWTYWKVTGDASIFTPDLAAGFERALDTMEREQDHPRNSHYAHKELPDGGRGNPVAYTGMIWTGFRPSDDACKYNYLIPSEMMAVVALGELEEIERDVYHNLIKAERAKALRDEVQTGIQTYGVVFTPNYGYVYAYEVDGLGNATLMDDANVPSLLSAPYLGYTTTSSFIYRNTRRFLLSKDNPTYYVGKYARGIGSQHTNDGYVWPLAMLMQGFTASSAAEKKEVLAQLLASDPGDHLLHESFNPDDPEKFSRVDFGWPNALFSEFVLTSFEGVPSLPVGSTKDLDFRGD